MLFKCYCGIQFETTFEKFRLNNKRQCTTCGIEIMKKKQSLCIEDVLTYVNENSNCTLISTEYVNTKSPLLFKCSCGTLFEKSFEKFKSKEKQCKNCSYLDISKNQTFSYDFVKKYIENNNCILLDDSYINCESKINIECPCGETFVSNFNSFRNYNQIRCRKCTRQMSKGEILIENYLKKNKLKYTLQYKFDDLKALNNKHFLKFDFAVFTDNSLITLIEFDGEQHFKPIEFYGGIDAFNTLQTNDTMKNNYCKANEINLLRISFKEINDIENILNNYFIL